MEMTIEIAESGFGENRLYPQNDIGIAQLFFNLHRGNILYVAEAKSWYTFDGQRWDKDEGGFKTMELCKSFVRAFGDYAEQTRTDDNEFLKWAGKLTSRRNREGILRDAMSIAPVSIGEFDKDLLLINVQNGTLNLKNYTLQPHNPADMITKLAGVKYNPMARCTRWDNFINEIMCDDVELAVYLQKVLGYSLTGLTEYEEFYILYGEKTRNGKTTLIEGVANIFGDYACNIQPQSLAKRGIDGAAPSPDMARLKGARFVTAPEPEKGLELNIALLKQLTGGDRYTARHLNANPFEFKPEFKLLFTTNHLPRTADDTVFASGRVKLIPFERHFSENEQDRNLKRMFRKSTNRSHILNWLIAGLRLVRETGLVAPPRVVAAIEAYRSEADVLGTFLAEFTVEDEKNYLPTSLLYPYYHKWAKDNGYSWLNNTDFVVELRKKVTIKRNGKIGNRIVGLSLAPDVIPQK